MSLVLTMNDDELLECCACGVRDPSVVECMSGDGDWYHVCEDYDACVERMEANDK